MLHRIIQHWLPTVTRLHAFRRRRMPGPWREELVLGDGRTLWLRPIEPADAEPMRWGFPQLNRDEVRMRFLHPMKELPPDMAYRFTHIDPRSEFALVVTEPLPPGEALIGAVVRAVVDPGTRRAEYAILVTHFITGHGIGRLLMRKMIEWCRRKRLEQVYGDVLRENTPMLNLVEELGFRREACPGDPGLVRVVLDLQAAADARRAA